MSRLSFIIVFSLLGSTYGFVPSPSSSHNAIFNRDLVRVNKVGDPTGFDSFSKAKDVAKANNMPLGEAQRPFRRTVYSHDDWKLHRSQDRFFYYLLAIFNSGVYKNLGREVGAVTAIATFVVLINGLAGGFTDPFGVQHAALLPISKIGLPLSTFTLTSPSLGLLLVFRTNSSYQRWDEARKNWGMNINHTRDLVRMANAYYDSTGISPEQRQEDLNYVALCTWAFVRAMKRHLSPVEEDEEDFKKELYQKLPEQQATMIINAAHRPNRALQDLSYAIENLPMHYLRKNEIHRAATIFEDNLGSSERILTSPVPLFYSRHLARYLGVWLLLLPLGLYDTFSSSWNHIAMIPAAAVISTFLFGIEEIGTQLEEPFTVLPMQAFCDKIYNWCTEIMSWSPGDNGRQMKSVQDQHAYFTKGALNGMTSIPEPVPTYIPEPVTNYAYDTNAVNGVNGIKGEYTNVDSFETPKIEKIKNRTTVSSTSTSTITSSSVADLNKQWAIASKGFQEES